MFYEGINLYNDGWKKEKRDIIESHDGGAAVCVATPISRRRRQLSPTHGRRSSKHIRRPARGEISNTAKAATFIQCAKEAEKNVNPQPPPSYMLDKYYALKM
jgi:hypothetical protein